MGTKDFFDLFKLNILKNGLLYLLLIFWLVLYTLFNQYSPPIIELTVADADQLLIPLRYFRLIFWILTFLVAKELFSRFIAFIKRGIFYEFTSDSWYKDWIFNGKTKILKEFPPTLRVNSSRAGCLLDRYIWKNFEMKFDMRFLERGIIGIVFRAEDLDNYFMLQLKKGDSTLFAPNGSISIVPHIRYLGMWEQMSQDILGAKKNNSGWLEVTLKAKDNTVIFNVSGIGTYTWNLPTHVDINHIESGNRKNQNSSSNADEKFVVKATDLPKIPFKDTFGRIGFRAHKQIYMKNIKRNEIVEGTFGKMQLIKDFLPRPEELVKSLDPSPDVKSGSG